MCGIVGFNWDDKILVKEMNKVLEHRGPDGFGVYTDKNVSLGHRRLAIIDLSKNGHQPMCDDSGTIFITFNGEIYNYKELKKELEKKYNFKSETDTEVIIHAYREYGSKFLEKLNGDFAFCIYDSNKNKLILARDNSGVKPLYYYFSNGKFIFASEIKAILEYPIKRIINNKSISQYLAFRFVFSQNTIFKDIFRILPGEFIIFDLKKKTLRKEFYWRTNSSNTTNNLEYYKRSFKELFSDSVKIRLMSDVPLGVYLSGGIDSSSVVAMMKSFKVDKIKTFSVGFNEGINELPNSKKVSEFFNTEHKEFIVRSDITKDLPKIIWHSDEPLCDPAMMPVYTLSRNAKKYVSVVLTGDGADETLAGYEQVKFINFVNNISKIPFSKSVIKLSIKNSPNLLMNKIFKYSSALGDEGRDRAIKFVDNIDNISKAYTKIVSIFDAEEQASLLKSKNNKPEDYIKNYFIGNDAISKILNFETKVLLPENMLTKSDRMTMAFAIEARVPFLDKRLIDLASSIPSNLKLNHFKDKYILRKSMQGILPKETIKRKKQRFYVPIDHWLKKDLSQIVETNLSKNFLVKQNIFNTYQVEKIRNNFNKAPLFYGRQLWSLLTFQMWYKKFIEDS